MDINLQLISILPNRYLLPYIDYYWIAKTNEGQSINRLVNVFPITMHTLIFFRGDVPSRVISGSKMATMPKVCMIGMVVQNDRYLLKGNVDFIAIRFKPLGLYRFFDLSPRDFVSKNIDFKLYGKEIKCICEYITEINDTGSIVNCLNEYFLKRLNDFERKIKKIKLVNTCIETIQNRNGNATIKEICEKTALSERGFRKLFMNSVGISPKLFSRINRFNYVFSNMILQQYTDLFDVIEHVGYYDQSHFLKEFKSFTGKSLNKFQSNFKEFDELHRGDLR